MWYGIDFSFLLEQKSIIIIGGVFLGLAIYSYFYRANLIHKRHKRIQEIKQLLHIYKNDIMAKMKDKSRDELEHEALNFRIEKISNDMNNNNKVLMIQMNTEFEILNIRLDKLDKIIVRVEKLEQDTEFIRASKRWKWVVGLAIIGLITTVNFEQIKNWVAKIVPW